MNQPTYEELTIDMAGITSKILQKTDPDGSIWFIPIDPTNSDYQQYLNSNVSITKSNDVAPAEKPKK